MSDPHQRDDLAAALADLGAQLRRAASSPPKPRRPRTWGVVAGLAAAILLVSPTPPGRALADRMGELVGIGGEPTKTEVRVGFDSQAVVIGAGDGPNGVPFEVVASHNQDPEQGRSGYADDCAGISVPSRPIPAWNPDDVGSRLCLTPELYRTVAENPLTLSAWPEKEGLSDEPTLQITGFALAPVEAVEVTYPDASATTKTIEPQIYSLNAELASQIGAREPFGLFVAFVPVPDEPNISTVLGEMEAVGLDASGEQVASAEILAHGLTRRSHGATNRSPEPGSGDESGAETLRLTEECLDAIERRLGRGPGLGRAQLRALRKFVRSGAGIRGCGGD